MKNSNMNKRGFASDNNAGVHQDILKSLQEVNSGHTHAYGDDQYTKKAIDSVKNSFGGDAEVFFVFIGTAANVLSLKAMTNSHHAIICAETAHINEDECGAPEKFTACKLLPVETTDGKLNVENIQKYMYGFGDEHHAQPKVISITQSTELGTVYTIEEIKTLAAFAHKHGMYLHMDGARISNAAVSLDASFYEFTADAGVDVLSFGGTKNGMMYGEAVVFFNKELSENFKYIRKQGMQLASKMRYIAAQFSTFLSNDLWKKNAAHANKMAKLLYNEVKNIPGIEITQKVESNGVFAIIPSEIIPILQKEYFFYVWDEDRAEVRWMTSFDTTEDDILQFSAILRHIMKSL
jgi:threonine aldolase